MFHVKHSPRADASIGTFDVSVGVQTSRVVELSSSNHVTCALFHNRGTLCFTWNTLCLARLSTLLYIGHVPNIRPQQAAVSAVLDSTIRTNSAHQPSGARCRRGL
jgi:hypothetical protein